MPGRATWSLLGTNGAPAGDFAFDDRGHLALDRTAATPMITTLLQHLDAWWAHPAHGSRIAALMAGEPETAHTLESAVHEALAPLQRDRRIQDIDVQVTIEGTRARVRLSVYDISRAAPVTLEIVPLWPL